MAKRKKTVVDKVKIKIIVCPAGKFCLSYNVGEIHEVNAEQAKVLIDAKYAEKVK